jgi:AraC-like DNA-binding protein
MVVATYAIGYRGLQQAPATEVAVALPSSVEAPLLDESAPMKESVSGTDSVAVGPHDRPLLSPGIMSAIERRLHLVMDRDQPWRDPDLTLSGLAARINTTTHKLSAVLNGRVAQSFYDFVNGYRVRDVQRQLLAPNAASRTLLAMSMDAGFASKSTFNAVFRRQVGMTPSAWREVQQASSQTLRGVDVRTDPAVRPDG